jgi:RNA-binding protein
MPRSILRLLRRGVESYSSRMYDFPLTGAQKSFLRGLGQTLQPALKVGKGGLTPAFFAELQKLLRAHELVKLRFLGAERDERAALYARIADEGRCVLVGAVGHTAMFYRQNPSVAERKVTLP